MKQTKLSIKYKAAARASPKGKLLVWKNPSGAKPSKAMVDKARELGIQNIDKFGRYQAKYIIHIAHPANTHIDKAHGKGYCAKKLSEMGVVIRR